MLIDEAKAYRLMNCGLTELNISIDAALPETYRKVRRGGKLDILHDNIRMLVKAKRETGAKLPLIGMNYVLLNENEGELVKFVEQAADFGVDFINCVTYATYDWGFQNRRTHANYERELSAARKRMAELNVRVKSFPSEDVSWSDSRNGFGCQFFWGEEFRVSFEGEITLGCCTPFKESFSYGNLLRQPFTEIWNNEKYSELSANVAGQARAERDLRILRQTRQNLLPQPRGKHRRHCADEFPDGQNSGASMSFVVPISNAPLLRDPPFVVWLCLLAAAIGVRVFRLLKAPDKNLSRLERSLLAAGVGFGLLSNVALILGSLHHSHAPQCRYLFTPPLHYCFSPDMLRIFRACIARMSDGMNSFAVWPAAKCPSDTTSSSRRGYVPRTFGGTPYSEGFSSFRRKHH